MNRKGQRGEGRVGFFLAVVVVGVAIFVGVKIIPVRIAAYEFRDTLREEARYGAVRDSDAKVIKRIMDKAIELDIPLNKQNLTVQRTPNEMIIRCRYEQPIDLKLTTYVYRFDAKERAPRF